MKLCKDCKWYRPLSFTEPHVYCATVKIHDEYCSNPKASCKMEDVVVGEVKDFAFKCKEDPRGLRGTLAACGPTAKWFEEKEKPVPKCAECKYGLRIDTLCMPFRLELLCSKCGIPSTSSFATIARKDESMCGKYGKWFEKKVEMQRDEMIELALSMLDKTDEVVGSVKPKKQSWLCKLVCGRK